MNSRVNKMHHKIFRGKKPINSPYSPPLCLYTPSTGQYPLHDMAEIIKIVPAHKHRHYWALNSLHTGPLSGRNIFRSATLSFQMLVYYG